MRRYLFRFLDNLRLRWKMLVVVMPLVIVPIVLVGAIVGTIASRQAYLGITAPAWTICSTCDVTTDLLNAHHQQFQVYKRDKQKTLNLELATLVNLSYNLVEAEHHQYTNGRLSLAAARQEARKALRKVNVGETGYIYAMTTNGDLMVHLAREGENVYNERDENGRYFIRIMCEAASSRTGRGPLHHVSLAQCHLGDTHPRRKIVATAIFANGTGSRGWQLCEMKPMRMPPLSGTLRGAEAKIRGKKVGDTGYFYCMDSKGTLMIPPFDEGANIFDARDLNGSYFIREMCRNKKGWIRYPWKNKGDRAARMKIVRYEYFKPWDWIVAVGSYEDEFYSEPNKIKGRITTSIVLLTLLVGAIASGMVVLASKVLTDPINRMIEVIRRVKRGA